MPEEVVGLTLAEVARILDPPLPGLYLVVRALHWKPVGYRHTGRSGRPAPAYNATRLLQLHAALLPFLD